MSEFTFYAVNKSLKSPNDDGDVFSTIFAIPFCSKHYDCISLYKFKRDVEIAYNALL